MGQIAPRELLQTGSSGLCLHSSFAPSRPHLRLAAAFRHALENSCPGEHKPPRRVVNAGHMHAISLGRGAKLFEANALAFDSGGSSVNVSLDNGREIEARYAVLATGYVMPEIVRPEIQHATSSWAIATTPQPQNLWQDGVLIWEDSKDYHYARTTADGRIIFGGEDDSTIVEPGARDAAVPVKAKRSHKNLRRCGRARPSTSTVDGPARLIRPTMACR